MEEKELLYGTIQTVVYQNPDNGYAVLKLDVQEKEPVTVVGTIPMPAPGEEITLSGSWSTHATYGRQFKGEVVERLLPSTLDGILQFLSGGAIPGVGAKTAQKLVSVFGLQTLDVIENHPDQLQTKAGLTLKRARAVSDGFRSQISARQLVEFLSANHFSPSLALRVYRQYGDNSLEEVQMNPYLLTDEMIGADFAQADALAISMGIAGDDPRRVQAGVLHELEYNLNSGHVFLPREKLIAATVKLLTVDSADVEEALEKLTDEGSVVQSAVGKTQACYLKRMYEAETYTAWRLKRMAGKELACENDLERQLEKVQRSVGVQFTAEQQEAIRLAGTRQLLILTGGPGTGKTTTVQGILALYQQLGLTTLLAAPTGRAAKRMEELCGEPASTIHRMLEVQYDENTGQLGFFHDEDCPLKTDAVIVDEVSMLDISLMASLLKGLPDRCRLILVGDRDQLPPVGPGKVLSGILLSNVAATVCLSEIFRQARQSLIVTNAHAVNQGKLPVLNITNKDFFFMKRRSPEDVVKTVCDLCQRRLPDNMGIPADQIQVLSPTRLYPTGTVNLNRCLQQALNPADGKKKEVIFGDYLFREGDKVMQVRNNYDIIWSRENGDQGCGIFNGDVGFIQSIKPADRQLTICFDDRTVEYTFDMLQELEPAYAMTVHKSQGSEYRAVILTVFQGAQMLLTRSVLYTAITRARELLILVGDENIVAVMTNNAAQNKRFSALRYRLQQDTGEVTWGSLAELRI